MESATLESVESQFSGYAPPDEEKPLGSYAVLIAGFNAVLAGLLFARHRDLPKRIGLRDLVLLAVATQRLSRLIAKDKVTSAIRAPFVRYEEDAGPSEVSESPRGSGMRRAIGELISCPFC